MQKKHPDTEKPFYEYACEREKQMLEMLQMLRNALRSTLQKKFTLALITDFYLA